MKYFNYIDIVNWKDLQSEIIHFWKNTPLPDPDYESWQCYPYQIIKEKIPNLYNTFKDMNLELRHMIIFINMPNDINVKDHTSSKAIFIHVDAKDEKDWEETQFEPTNAINIPLINCEQSTTLFYKMIAEEYVYYPEYYQCGGLNHNYVEEVDRFVLDKPAILRVNVPHGVLNPTNDPRIVATFRFFNEIEHLFESE